LAPTLIAAASRDPRPLVCIVDATTQRETELPQPWLGGRIGIPEHGYAIVFSDDWTIYRDADTEPEEIVRGMDAALRRYR
jgi:hypothetical protein